MQIRKRLTYANVMSSIAVFLVLGGATAFAANQLGKNTVGSKQLKKNAVVTAKIKANAVTSAKIKNGAVTSGKIANGAVLVDKLGDGSVTTGKIANDAVTGAKVNESTLGAVPNATNAGTAAALTTLPSGKSESGFYAAGGGDSTSGYIAQGISFQQPLAAPIPEGNVEWLKEGEFTATCPAVGKAAPNHLCLYDNEESAVSLCCIYDFAFNDPAADKNGFIVYWQPTGTGSYVSGEWTVTAP